MFDAMAIQELMARYLRNKEAHNPFKNYGDYLQKSGMKTMPSVKGMPQQTTVPLRPEDVDFEEAKTFYKTVY